MMEFESPNFAQYSYVVKREKVDAPLDWQLGASNLNQSDLLAMDTAVHRQAYSPMTSDAPFPGRSQSNEYGWTDSQPSSLGQITPGQAGDDITTYLPNNASEYGGGELQNASAGLEALLELNAELITNTINNTVLPNPEQWQQGPEYQQVSDYRETLNNGTFDENSLVQNGSNPMGLGLYLPEYQPIKIEVEEPLIDMVDMAGSSSGHGFILPSDESYVNRWQADEGLDKGFTSVTSSEITDSGFLLQNMSRITDMPSGYDTVYQNATGGFQEPNAIDIADELFTAEELGLPANTPSLALSPAPSNYQMSQHSREVSVAGNWSSPKTPQHLDRDHLSSPLNGQGVMIAGTQVEQLFSSGHLQVTTTVKMSPLQPNFKDLTSNFDTNPKPESRKRTRKHFTAEEKVKVNSVRDEKACVSCHARKVSCTPGEVCDTCLKTTGDPVLAKEICLRRKLKDTFVGVRVLHDTLDRRKLNLQPLLASLIGEPKSVDLTVENTRLGYTFRLRLQVMKCASSPECRWKRLARVNGIYITEDIIYDQRYVIVPESLPTADQFDAFGRKILATANGSHSGELTQDLDNILLRYCQRQTSQPTRLQRLANATLRVASLNRLVAYGFLNLYDGSYDLLDRTTGAPLTGNTHTRRYVSETVHDQLRLLAAEGLEPTENVIFSEIDDLSKITKTGKNGKIIAGICVLRLMLLYRDRVIRDSIRLKLPNSDIRHETRLQKAAYMYKRLTIVYGTLSREGTPLTMAWLPEQGDVPTAEDNVLLNLFKRLQPAFEDFCNERLASQYDDILKGLIIDAPKVERRPNKKQKTTAKTLTATPSSGRMKNV